MVHKLRSARMNAGLSVVELAVKSDISIGAIYRIEGGKSEHKTHVGVASALADALGHRVYDLFHDIELSDLGRTPHTGRPIEKKKSALTPIRTDEVICPNCMIVMHKSRGCDDCGYELVS